MSKCPKCKNKLLTVTAFVDSWDADDEPYESGEREEHEGISQETYFSAEYCEQCEQFLWIEIEADMLKNGSIKKRRDVNLKAIE